MKLIGLSIEGLRKIKAAELDFNGKHLVQVRGANGAGKSTVLDAIRFLLKGTRDIPGGVVTQGSEESVLLGKIDDFIVKRVIKADGRSALSVEREGGKVARPQEFLDSISGQFLDPEWFAKLPGTEKRSVLMGYVGIDFTAIDAKIAQAEQDRLVCGRELKALGDPAPVSPCEAVSLTDLMAKRKELADWNSRQDSAAAALARIVQDAKAAMMRCFDGKDSIKGLSEALDAAKAEHKKRLVDMTIVMPQEKRDLSEVEGQIANAEATNDKARKYAEYIAKRDQKEAKKREYEELGKRVDELRQERIDMVKAAKLPVEGLQITETGLSHDGVSDENWSDSEALKIALMLAVAFSGELRAVYIKRGEALDAASLAKVKAFAEAEDFQVIMEIVDDSYEGIDDGVVWIEEGEILSTKEIAGQIVAERAGGQA